MRPSRPTGTVGLATHMPCVAGESESVIICTPPSPWTVPWRQCCNVIAQPESKREPTGESARWIA
jgi:hypothetical protein